MCKPFSLALGCNTGTSPPPTSFPITLFMLGPFQSFSLGSLYLSLHSLEKLKVHGGLW